MTLRRGSSLRRQNPILFDIPLKTPLHQANFFRPTHIDYHAAFVYLNGLVTWSYIHTCGSLQRILLLAIQGTIAHAMSPYAALAYSTARAASCGYIAIFDYKCDAQAGDTLSSIEAHIGPERH